MFSEHRGCPFALLFNTVSRWCVVSRILPVTGALGAFAASLRFLSTTMRDENTRENNFDTSASHESE